MNSIALEYKKFLQLDKSSIIFLILLCLTFYLPRINGIDYGSIFLVLCSAFGFLIRIKNIINDKLNKVEVFFISLILSQLLFLALKSSPNLSSDSYYLLRVIRTTSMLYLLYIGSRVLKLSLIQLFKVLLIASWVHLLLVYLQYFTVGDLKLFFLKLNPIFDPAINLDEFNNVMVGGKRVKGAMNGFDGAGLLIANIFAMSLVFFRKNLNRLILIIICFIGCLVTSRTGLVIFLFVLCNLVALSFIKDKKIFLKLLVAMLFSFFTIFYVATSLFPKSTFTESTIRNSFEVYFSFKESGKFKLNSFEDMVKNHYVIGSNDISLVGNPERQVYRSDGKILSASQSDIGYLQILGNFGIPLLLLIIGIHFVVYRKIYKVNESIFDVRLILILSLLISCFKGPYFFGRLNYDIICLICFMVGFEDKKMSLKEFII